MQDINVDFTKMSAEDVLKYVAMAEKSLGVLKVLAKFTPTTLDDNALVAIGSFLDAVKPYLSEPWVLELLNMVLGLFKKNPQQLKEFFEAVKAIN